MLDLSAPPPPVRAAFGVRIFAYNPENVEATPASGSALAHIMLPDGQTVRPRLSVIYETQKLQPLLPAP